MGSHREDERKPYLLSPRRLRTPDRILALVVAVLVIAAAGWVVVLGIRAYGKTSDWYATSGTVVDVHEGSEDDWDTSIRFTDTDGFEYTIRNEYGSRQTREGDKVDLKYPPRNPARAETSSDTRHYAQGFLVAALVMAGIAMVPGTYALGRDEDFPKLRQTSADWLQRSPPNP